MRIRDRLSRRILIAGWFVIWVTAMGVLIACMPGGHNVAFRQAELSQPVVASALPQEAGWQVVHVLSVRCKCAGQVAQRILGRKVMPGLTERVWFVAAEQDGNDDDGTHETLAESGFDVSRISPDELERHWGIQGGPWLLVVAPGGRVAYSGGYAPRRVKAPDDVRDVEIVTRLLRGETVTPFPAFGCATSASLRAALDPLGIEGN